MTAPGLRLVLLLFSLTTIAACDHKAEPLKAPDPLSRPTVAVIVHNGRVLVPRTCMTTQGGMPGVFVVTDGVARFRMVRTGKHENSHIEILSGLTGNEQLVAGDLQTVHDGSPITVANGDH